MNNQIPINPGRKEIIRIFMAEAKKKSDLKSGFKPIFNEAIGLVETCVAFEAFINELLFHSSIFKKRGKFSEDYQRVLTTNLGTLEKWIAPLKEELDKYFLEDMTPNSTRNPINIGEIRNLNEVIEIIYRVRSNLVHGSKSLDSKRNELLIGNSFHFLYAFLEIIFKEEKII